MKFKILIALIVVLAIDSSTSNNGKDEVIVIGGSPNQIVKHIKEFKLADATRIAKLRNFNHEYDSDWKKYKKSYARNYEKKDEDLRRVIWENALAHINHHNQKFESGEHTFKIGLNSYADLAQDEFVKTYNGFKMPSLKSSGGSNKQNREMPFKITDKDALSKNKTVDWRWEGLVTSVKNQGQCGGCWAFSATGALEGAHALKTEKLIDLSMQNLIDCSEPQGNSGCNGGTMQFAFQYIIDKGGIEANKSYPYKAKQQRTCSFNKAKTVASCRGFVNVPSGDEEALRKAVAAVGPVSVAIDASLEAFQLYQEGIFDEPKCTQKMDHGVLVVGYGTENGVNYWLVKNSWGSDWGMNGFIKMIRNKNNQCGIANQAIYPVV